MKRTILRSAAVLGTVGFAGFLLAACSNSSSGSSEASKEINVYVDKGYKSYVEEAAKALAQTPEEKQFLMDNTLPQMIVGGFVTVTITSVIIAGIFVNLI